MNFFVVLVVSCLAFGVSSETLVFGPNNLVQMSTIHQNGSIIKQIAPAINCKGHQDCSYHGHCASDNSMCMCDPSFVTVPPTAFPQCNKKYLTEKSLELLSYVPSFLLSSETLTDGPGPVFINCTGPADCSYNGDCSTDKKLCTSEYMTLPATAFPQCNKHMFWVGLVGACIIAAVVGAMKEEAGMACGGCLIVSVVLAAIIWNIILWAKIINNDLYDGDGAPLYSW